MSSLTTTLSSTTSTTGAFAAPPDNTPPMRQFSNPPFQVSDGEGVGDSMARLMDST
jgi:hypothetical protein